MTTTKRRPARASSPDSDVMDRLSSSPEPPEDPLAGVVIGSQSRAAMRGEYVPVPTRSNAAMRSSEARDSSRTTPVVAPAPRPVSRPKPASKSQPKAIAKPPSWSQAQSRPPASKGKGKAKEVIEVIEVSDSDDDTPVPITLPLLPSRRGNVVPPASTSKTTRASTATTITRKKRPSTDPSTSEHRQPKLQIEFSADGAEDGPLVTANVSRGVSPGSNAHGAAKRRRIEKPVHGEGETQALGVTAGAGVPMDVDVEGQDMDVDAGYESVEALEYMSEVESQPSHRRQHKVVREEGPTPVRADADTNHNEQHRHEPDAQNSEAEEEERPFPDFESLRASTTAAISVPTTSSSKSTSSLSTGARRALRENAVAGPSNSNPASTSAAISSSAKSDPNSSMVTNLQLNPHASLFDDAGMSPEDALAAYAAMFGDEEERPPAPAPAPAPSLAAEQPCRPVVEAEEGHTWKGKGKARAEEEPVVESAIAPEPAPVLNWGAWDPLRASGHAHAHASGGSSRRNDARGENPGKEVARVREREPATMEEHFLHALRAATAVHNPGDSKGKASEVEVEEVPLHVAYMRRAAKAFEQAWGGGMNMTAGKARQDDAPAAVTAAQNAFTFTFPRGAAEPAVPPAQPPPIHEEQDQGLHVQQPAVPPPARDPWAFLFAPPVAPAPLQVQQVKPQAHPAPEARAFGFGAPPAPGVALANADGCRQQHPPAASPPVPLPSVPLIPPAPVAPRPGAFTFVFPRGAAGPTALDNARDPVHVPSPIVAPVPPVMLGNQPQPQLLPVPPAAPVHPAPLAQPLPVRRHEALVHAPMLPPALALAPPVQAVPPAAAPVAAPVLAPQPAPAPVVVPAPAPAPGPLPVPALTREQLTARAIAQITEVLPDIEPGYLLAHVSTYVGVMGERTAEHVFGILFEAEAAGGYPRIVRARPQPEPAPAQSAPAPVQRLPAQPQVLAPPQRPQPVAGGSNLGVRARAGSGQEGAPQRQGDEPANKKAKVAEAIDYEDVNRRPPSEACRRLSVHYLRLAFPYLPKHVVTTALYQHNNLYAPTYLHLYAAEQRYTAFPVRDERPYRCNSTKYNATPERRALARVWDEAFGEEWLWVEARPGRSLGLDYAYANMRASHGAPDAAAMERALQHQDPALMAGPARVQPPAQVPVALVPAAVVDNGKGKQRAVDVEMDPPIDEQLVEAEGDIECGCCFSEYTFDKMVQCPDAHLFCSECVAQYAATQLGAHNPSLVCMHSSDCKLPFPESELRRVLTPTLMALYSRLTAQRAVAAAGLEGLEECPFCDWQCVIEAPIEVDRLFRCGNEEGGCGVVSCRECKKKDHLPKTCKEMEEDQVLDGQHAIEEAMTRALMRNCPNTKCKKAFVKETGCNKMTCPHCRTLSCYVCREIITGYEHFGVMPGAALNTAIAGKCKLWENDEERHANEVRAAAERAAEELRRANPEIDHEAIKVDIPIAPPAAPVPAAHRAVPAPVGNPRQILLQQQAAQLRLEHDRQRQRAQEEARREQELRAEIVRRERERQAEQRRLRKQREREAQELRMQEALRTRLQQQQDLYRAARVTQHIAERLNPVPLEGPVRDPPPAVQPPGPHAPTFSRGAEPRNRGRRKQ